eukprot:COSAG02_NODE_2783_length_8036_cov_41.488976_8_plen_45_part_00
MNEARAKLDSLEFRHTVHAIVGTTLLWRHSLGGPVWFQEQLLQL